MATLDKIKVGGVDYDIVDSQARADIGSLKSGSVTKTELDAKQNVLKDDYIFSVRNTSDGRAIEVLGKSFSNQSTLSKNEKIDFKTINGERIFGTGDITVVADVSNLATKDELNGKQNKISGSYVSSILQDEIDNVLTVYASDFEGGRGDDNIIEFKTINGEAILGKGNITVAADVSNLATKDELNGKQDKIDGTFVGSFETDGNSIKYENYEFSDYRGGGELEWIEFKTINGENILGEGNLTVQGKLDGDYVKDVEIGGGYITFNSMKFDGNNNGVKTANFKTINNQPILGSGNINIDVDTSNLATKSELTSKADASDLGGLKLVKITQIEYDILTNKDENTLYVIYD